MATVYPGQVVTFALGLEDANGLPTFADSLPAVTVTDGTTPVTATVTQSGTVVGRYSCAYTAPAAGVWASGGTATAYASYTIAGVAPVPDPEPTGGTWDIAPEGASNPDQTPAWADLAAFKARLGITGTSQDAQATAALDAAASAIITALGYDPQQQSYSEYPDCYGTETVVLRVSPVVSVTSVTEIAEDGSETALAADADYVWDKGPLGTSPVLVRRRGVWPYTVRRGLGRLSSHIARAGMRLRVVYLAGWNPVPAALTEALMAEATVYYRSQGTGQGTVLSDSIDGASLTVSQFPARPPQPGGESPLLSPVAARLLQPYLRRTVGRG